MLDIFEGPLMEEAGADGGGGGLAVESGTESTALVTTSGDTSLALTDDDSGAIEESAESETQLTTTGDPKKATAQVLQSIKQQHPQLARQIPRDMAIASRLRSMFPGHNAFEAISGLQKFHKAVGGEEGLALMRDSLGQMERMDMLYANGDPEMLRIMTESPDGKNAFNKIAPHAIALWEKTGPKAFARYMASTIMGDMVNQRVDMAIQRIAEMTPRELTGADGAKIPNPVVAELAKFQAYMDRLSAIEKLEPETVETKGIDPREQELETARQRLDRERKELALQGWKTSADSTKNKIFSAAWARETKGKKISPVDKEDIISRVASRLPIALKQIPDFSKNLQGFYDNNDREGYLRYLQSKHAEVLPRITKAEIQRRLGTAATATTTATAKTAATTTPKGQVDAGFKRISDPPKMNDVNVRLTGTDMWKKGRAIMKDGSRVQWL